MEQVLLEKLAEYGGAVAVIVALTIFTIYLKRNNNYVKKEEFKSILKSLEENHLTTLNNKIDEFYKEFTDFKVEISQRVAKLETLTNELSQKTSNKKKRRS